MPDKNFLQNHKPIIMLNCIILAYAVGYILISTSVNLFSTPLPDYDYVESHFSIFITPPHDRSRTTNNPVISTHI